MGPRAYETYILFRCYLENIFNDLFFSYICSQLISKVRKSKTGKNYNLCITPLRVILKIWKNMRTSLHNVPSQYRPAQIILIHASNSMGDLGPKISAFQFLSNSDHV